jgi:hypothetical protein
MTSARIVMIESKRFCSDRASAGVARAIAAAVSYLLIRAATVCALAESDQLGAESALRGRAIDQQAH